MNAPKKTDSFIVNPKNGIFFIFFLCLSVELTLFFLDFIFNFQVIESNHAIEKIFNLALEESVGTWFSICQSWMVALTLFAIFYFHKHLHGWKKSSGWGVLSLFFLYLSIDDGAKIHERISGVFRKSTIAHLDPTAWKPLASFMEKFPSYSWQLIYGPFLFCMACFILYFLMKKLPSERAHWILIGALSCWTVAIGMDYVEGLDGAFERLSKVLSVSRDHVSHFSKMAEEVLEMFGMTLFWVLFLEYFKNTFSHLSFQLRH